MKKLIRKLVRFMNKGSLGATNNRKAVGMMFVGLTAIVFLIFSARLIGIVGTGEVKNVSLKEKTKALYQGSSIVKAKRGTIYDRNGDPIAEDATSYSVYVVLSDTYVGTGNVKMYAQPKNFDRIAELLNKNIGMKKDFALKTLEKGVKDKRFQVEFGNAGKNISLSKRQSLQKALDDEKIKGVFFSEHPDRIYPNGQFASDLIGYANLKDQDDDSQGLTGVNGIEASYNDILSGKDGKITYQKDLGGNPMPGTVATKIDPVDGQDIYTTIDTRLQTYLETLMDEDFKKYEPKDATAILMSAKTGEVLATTQRPTFNADTKKFPEDYTWNNMILQSVFEPGSTMKTLTIAASQSEGLFNPNGTYTAGEIKVADSTIQDWDYSQRGLHTLTYAQGFSWSSNVGMVHLEENMGADNLHKYQERFMFDKKVNTGDLNENIGRMPDITNPVDMAMSSFGQGISVNQLQMMRMFSAYGNNGVMVQPQFVKKIVDNTTQTEREVKTETLGNPITSDVASMVRNNMVNVVQDPQWGSGYSASVGGAMYQVPGVTVAAKTGTAQIWDTKAGKYTEGQSNYIYSVVLIAPAEDPQYILYMTMNSPVHYVNATQLADVTNPLLRRALEADESDTPVKQNKTMKVKVPDFTGKGPNTSSDDARLLMLEPTVIGTGDKVVAQSEEVGKKLMPNQRVMLLTKGDMTMPYVYGWTKSDLDKLAKLMDVKFEYTGSGNAVSQSVAYNTKVKKGDTISITLSH